MVFSSLNEYLTNLPLGRESVVHTQPTPTRTSQLVHSALQIDAFLEFALVRTASSSTMAQIDNWCPILVLSCCRPAVCAVCHGTPMSSLCRFPTVCSTEYKVSPCPLPSGGLSDIHLVKTLPSRIHLVNYLFELPHHAMQNLG